jgi:hypothetical protein
MAFKGVIALPSLLQKLEEHGYETIEELKNQRLFDLRDGTIVIENIWACP